LDVVDPNLRAIFVLADMAERKLVRHSDLLSLTGVRVDTPDKGQVKLPEVDAWGWYQETFEQRLYKGERGRVKEVINVANLSARLLKMVRIVSIKWHKTRNSGPRTVFG
jgi:hypothetical protein